MARVELYGPRKNHGFMHAVMHLIGHVLGGAFLFASLATVAWLLGAFVARLHETHAFTPQVLTVLHSTEIALLYLDVLLSGIVVVIGAFKFVRDISGDRHDHF